MRDTLEALMWALTIPATLIPAYRILIYFGFHRMEEAFFRQISFTFMVCIVFGLLSATQPWGLLALIGLWLALRLRRGWRRLRQKISGINA